MPNFPSIYLELQELWKRIRGLDEASLEIKQKLQCINRIEDPSVSTLVQCDLRISGSNNPGLYVGPLAQDSTTGSNAELIIIGRQNDAYISTWDGTARTVLGSTNGIGFVGTQTDDNFTIRQYNDPVITVKKQSGDDRIVTVSGSMEITGNLNNGFNCLVDGIFSHAEGQETEASGNYSHTEGRGTKTFEASSWAHAEGVETIAGGAGSHAEGYRTLSQNPFSHAEGVFTTSSAYTSHTEGSGSVTNGLSSHAEGVFCYTEGTGSHAEGYYTTASGDYSHAEGDRCIAGVGGYSHAEGGFTKAYQTYAHAEGLRTYANGYASHTEGHFTTASAYYAHAEGSGSVANASASHAEGIFCLAGGKGSHAEGLYATASLDHQHVQGKYNLTSSTALMIVGNGTGPEPENRSNILEVETGSVYIGGELQLKSGNGIKFGVLNPISNPDVTSVTLDDYEEGTWTPTQTGISGVSSLSGSYVKVGNLVHLTGLLKTTTAITASVGDYITGFPYTPDNNSIDSSPVLFTNHGITSRASINNGYLYGSGSITWFDRLYTPSFTSTDDIKFSCTYKTS